MEGRIVSVEARQLLGIGWTGPYSAARELPRRWREFVQRAEEIPGRVHPGTFLSPIHGRKTDFTVYIAVEVDPDDEAAPPEGLVRLTLPDQRYAVMTHRGPASRVQETYRALYAWMEKSGLHRDKDALWLEVYDQGYTPAADEHMGEGCAFDVYVPLA